MDLTAIKDNITVCKVSDISEIDMTKDFFFLGKTNDEISLVCKTEQAPANCISREDGWKGFYIDGMLDFSMVGVLAKISTILADNGISIFSMSTYNTDYILVKEHKWGKAMSVLMKAGYKLKQ
ncbi:ACT domain-containing protein [Anaerovibrio lipolyticus]|uniref:ACT domain-containing protein n=1 Tax=Anaerovibrio lipolyticus TaxID=82374 RepID=UPI0026EC6658|nr:ACT domain-containing protein [Anaerovibrio lipolyticus]MBE6106498.1 ACT domain-containing protein [Anaerovibrio lipolyticus]